jgi:hypothetical protein
MKRFLEDAVFAASLTMLCRQIPLSVGVQSLQLIVRQPAGMDLSLCYFFVVPSLLASALVLALCPVTAIVHLRRWRRANV